MAPLDWALDWPRSSAALGSGPLSDLFIIAAKPKGLGWEVRGSGPGQRRHLPAFLLQAARNRRLFESLATYRRKLGCQRAGAVITAELHPGDIRLAFRGAKTYNLRALDVPEECVFPDEFTFAPLLSVVVVGLWIFQFISGTKFSRTLGRSIQYCRQPVGARR